MSKKTILYSAIFVIIGTVIGEITFGNPDFPVTFWVFKTLAPWKWYLASHLGGFLFLLLVNQLFFNRSIIWPILLSTAYFSGGETLNWFFLHYFIYTDKPFGPEGAFWTIILAYLTYCAGQAYVLRKYRGVQGGHLA